MRERARLVYDKNRKSYHLETNRFSMNITTGTALNSDVMRSLIKLFSNEGKIQKVLLNMEKQEALQKQSWLDIPKEI